MSLRTALERFSADRATDAAVREVLALFTRHPGEWLEPGHVAGMADVSQSLAEHVLGVLRSAFVLDFDDDPPRYAYRKDRLLDLEIDRFLRRAGDRAGMLQSNVEKFRGRYGSR